MKIINFRSDENYQVDYYENGEKNSQGAFIGENFVGKWIWYDKQGVISKEEFYQERIQLMTDFGFINSDEL